MIQLDHYNGRAVEGVDYTEDSEHEWQIILSGGVRITNYDASIEEPKDLGGLALITVILSELDTRLVFGAVGPNANPMLKREVRLNPAHYSISDPEMPDQGEVYPQRPVELQEDKFYSEDAESVSEGEEEPEAEEGQEDNG